MNEIAKIFAEQKINKELLSHVKALPEPTKKYIIAMTPRSGSSHLCDVIKNTRLLGTPGEFLPREFMPKILERAPAESADQYIGNVLKVMQTPNHVSGLKTSWFQFQAFCGALSNRSEIRQFKYIYLTRRDLAAQAISLYKATESSVFHTNIQHSEQALAKLNDLDYNYAKIDEWFRHIVAQENGWQKFFLTTKIFPLFVTYEDIDSDVTAVVERIAAYLGVALNEDALESPKSIFKKLANRKNVEWSAKYILERDLALRNAEG